MRVIRAAAVAASGLGIVLAAPALAHTHPRTESAGAGRHKTEWTWPIAGAGKAARPQIVHGFEPPAKRWEAGHRGVDLLTEVGRDVDAAGAGTVSFAGPLFGRPVIAVDHTSPGRDTLRTTYEPVDAVVKVGQRVREGELIGHVAADAVDPAVGHCAPRACLHWGLVRGFGHDEQYLDPLSLVDRGPVRLLPIWRH